MSNNNCQFNYSEYISVEYNDGKKIIKSSSKSYINDNDKTFKHNKSFFYSNLDNNNIIDANNYLNRPKTSNKSKNVKFNLDNSSDFSDKSHKIPYENNYIIQDKQFRCHEHHGDCTTYADYGKFYHDSTCFNNNSINEQSKYADYEKNKIEYNKTKYNGSHYNETTNSTYGEYHKNKEIFNNLKKY